MAEDKELILLIEPEAQMRRFLRITLQSQGYRLVESGTGADGLLQAASRNPDVVLVDARPADMYTGKVVRHAVQGGHIPGALNVVSLDATDGQSQKWFDEEKLAAFYKDVPKDKTVYVYCHDGFRMSLGWLQMKSLGYQDVRVLDGGWGVWDRAFTLPVVQGDAPYDDEFAL